MTQRQRKLLGMFLLVGGIAVYGLVMADLLSRLPRLNIALESILYAAAGIAWIFLARPVLVWMETGSWWVRRDR
ncbi:DUF2842 domain-containing protein [Pedomonas mirosovicensis]|uniref:DUF2842 domain-containing protein n=1 Tax=Pedomonas mirosovicensis TaxID=2908641 RepID=UPI0021686BB8|nr:DUF2842 domain-containing protein [Pedomonas mirosovicensis]MCH8685368.1 DUF2842 domain-containing protein [Pedomonas mirosovicensis]